MFSRTRLYSILFNKCPRCHEGSFFLNNNPYRKGFSKMNGQCAVCKSSFEREPGFYYGAMYASYGLTVAFGIGLFLLMVVLFDMEVLEFLFTFSAGIIVLMPVLYRWSRLIWINLFVSPDKSWKKK
jgi:hypothetical protein